MRLVIYEIPSRKDVFLALDMGDGKVKGYCFIEERQTVARGSENRPFSSWWLRDREFVIGSDGSVYRAHEDRTNIWRTINLSEHFWKEGYDATIAKTRRTLEALYEKLKPVSPLDPRVLGDDYTVPPIDMENILETLHYTGGRRMPVEKLKRLMETTHCVDRQDYSYIQRGNPRAEPHVK